jgi:hypothetical protein
LSFRQGSPPASWDIFRDFGEPYWRHGNLNSRYRDATFLRDSAFPSKKGTQEAGQLIPLYIQWVAETHCSSYVGRFHTPLGKYTLVPTSLEFILRTANWMHSNGWGVTKDFSITAFTTLRQIPAVHGMLVTWGPPHYYRPSCDVRHIPNTYVMQPFGPRRNSYRSVGT